MFVFVASYFHGGLELGPRFLSASDEFLTFSYLTYDRNLMRLRDAVDMDFVVGHARRFRSWALCSTSPTGVPHFTGGRYPRNSKRRCHGAFWRRIAAKLQDNDIFTRQFGQVEVPKIFAPNSLQTASFRNQFTTSCQTLCNCVLPAQPRLLQEEVEACDQHDDHATTSVLRNAGRRKQLKNVTKIIRQCCHWRVSCPDGLRFVSGTLRKTHETCRIVESVVCTSM